LEIESVLLQAEDHVLVLSICLEVMVLAQLDELFSSESV